MRRADWVSIMFPMIIHTWRYSGPRSDQACYTARYAKRPAKHDFEYRKEVERKRHRA